ncbi:MAG: hypothetical protein M4579_006951 [Chaenotheca gracillima]|nr:MAG: hypothetical protein M4579_006951 [Chaenotheca gracillima]
MWAFSGAQCALVIAFLLHQRATLTAAQLFSQNNTFNSTATLTASQIANAGIDTVTADNIAVALNFERSNYAHGPASGDDFYKAPKKLSRSPAGTVLKVQVDANASLYTLPPNTAISRILYQSKNFNGSVVPASAYVLWPYTPRKQKDGYPVVAWAHGSSGTFGNCAPSNFRSLQYQFGAPFELALQGYVVVAPDYAGLGVEKDADGKFIPHQFAANPATANDLIYAVEAAQSAFKVLSKQFVVVGHSQGGGAAWSVAERQVKQPVKGYLGAVAGSPLTSLLAFKGLGALFAAFPLLTSAPISSVFPGFNISTTLLPAGQAILALGQELEGCIAVDNQLLGSALAVPTWDSSPYVIEYDRLIAAGGKKISGPLLVLQGEADPVVPFPVVSAAVEKTCKLYPQSAIEYKTYENITHVPVMYAAQRLWLDWIADRFARVPVDRHCHQTNYSSAKPYNQYLSDANWFIEYATQAYELS